MNVGRIRMNHKCFALTAENQCDALTVETCPGSMCSFYKTVEQQNESCRKANARLASLSKEKQIKIALKYYNGQIPWQ